MKSKEKENPEPDYKKPYLKPKTEEAFDSIFEDIDDNSSLEQRFDALLQTIVVNKFYLMDRQRSFGKPASADDIIFLDDCMSHLNDIAKCLSLAKKHGRIGEAPPNQNFEGEIVMKIRGKRQLLADIVQVLPPSKPSVENG